jgi:uncharacterized membrane protein (GlpM family)
MQTVIKMAVSGVVVGIITFIAKRNPALGGWIVAMPTLTLLSTLWLVVDREPTQGIARFLQGVLLGLIPTALFVLIAAVTLRRGVSLPVALALGAIAWGMYTLVAQRFGLLG